MDQQTPTVRLPLADDREESVSRSVSFAAARSRKRELLDELHRGAESGQPVRPEDLLPRWPTDPKRDPDVASLLFTDFCQRARKGESASVSDYEERFPEHKDSLAGLLHQHAVMRSLGNASGSMPTLRLPDVGEDLFGFRLCYELGSGAFARVYLAEQGDLADRPVVLKISGIDGHEPQTLAQLQHTNIVPIYSVHDDTTAGLRAVCMPYFGGASLSSVLRALWAQTSHPTRGRQFVEALRNVETPAWGRGRTANRELAADDPPAANDYGPSLPGSQRHGLGNEQDDEGKGNDPSPARAVDSAVPAAQAILEQSGYVQAVAWMMAQLADALQHAHQRGILHRDIKPSNILMSAEGQPMLLDFNLAYDTQGNRAQATRGGTVSYMAPEHLRALAARNPVLACQVDHRSDLYSLGMVLYEMLTGHSPFDQSASYTPLPVLVEAMALERGKAAPSLRRYRSDMPWGLESIVRKCLAPEQSQRYQQAAHLAEDLRRFLDDRPLKYAPELSTAERVRKWFRRHPRLTSSASVGSVALLLLLGTGAALAGVRQHLAHTREQLADTQAAERQRAYENGTVRALCLVNTISQVHEHARQGLEVCEETLALYDVLQRDDWQQHADWQRLSAADRQRLAEDTRELLLSLAWARVKTQPDSADAPRQALALLDRAEAIEDLEPSPALVRDRAYYLDQLGDTQAANRVSDAARHLLPHSARDHYLLATTYIHDKEPDFHARAIAELEEAIRLQPRHYWSWLQKGMCHLELKQHDLAAADFGTCIGLWPEFAFGYFNRGLALADGGHLAEAVADYTAALERDPTFLLAFLNRGSTRLALHQHEAALADFDRVLELAHDDASLFGAEAGRGRTLEELGRTREADAAFAAAFARAPAVSDALRLSLLVHYGFAVKDRLPRKAREAFAEVLRQKPGHPQALYGQGMLLMTRGDLDEALPCFEQVLQLEPNLVEARRYRGILLARLGRFDAASQDVNWCLEREPHSADDLYAGACVSALMAARWQKGGKSSVEADAAANQALTFLQAAFARGHGRDQAVTDPDLAGIQKHPQFQRLVSEKVP